MPVGGIIQKICRQGNVVVAALLAMVVMVDVVIVSGTDATICTAVVVVRLNSRW
jgi:hypothetical protein